MPLEHIEVLLVPPITPEAARGDEPEVFPMKQFG